LPREGDAAALPPTSTFEALRGTISARHGELPPVLRRIAEFALDHPNAMALETVAELARRAQVHPSALVRFAQSLGFAGFSDLQGVFRERLTEGRLSYRERLGRLRGAAEGEFPSDPAAVLRHFVAASRQALDHLEADVEPARVGRAVELLAAADVVHVAAQRRSFPLAAYIAYGLSHLGRRMQLLDGVGGMLLQQARSIATRDALVAVSFRPYAEETLAVTRQARDAGARVVAITDAPLSPLAPLGDVVLLVQDAEVHGFRALTASMCVATALIVALEQRLVGLDATNGAN
jgi:DNA-binding MurR/RpiR family transcriptional regulator